jgi:hypothetical protein
MSTEEARIVNELDENHSLLAGLRAEAAVLAQQV